MWLKPDHLFQVTDITVAKRPLFLSVCVWRGGLRGGTRGDVCIFCRFIIVINYHSICGCDVTADVTADAKNDKHPRGHSSHQQGEVFVSDQLLLHQVTHNYL